MLSDNKKKQQYDSFGDSKFHQTYSSEDIFNNTDFSSIFDELNLGNNMGSAFQGMFRGFGSGCRGSCAPSKGQDVEIKVKISFDEAYNGAERELKLKKDYGSTKQLKIKIPKGIKNGGKLRLSGKGSPSRAPGSPAGDLFVIVQVLDHPDYTVKEKDIEMILSIKIHEIFLGASKDVVTPKGIKTLKVPPMIKPGTRLRLKGLGLPVSVNSETRGALYIKIAVDIPSKLSPEQEQIVMNMKEEQL